MTCSCYTACHSSCFPVLPVFIQKLPVVLCLLYRFESGVEFLIELSAKRLLSIFRYISFTLWETVSEELPLFKQEVGRLKTDRQKQPAELHPSSSIKQQVLPLSCLSEFVFSVEWARCIPVWRKNKTHTTTVVFSQHYSTCGSGNSDLRG